MKYTFKNIVKNKYVLYIIALIALLDIIGYIMREEFSAVIFFYLIGMITYYYNKNMTIVLGTCLIVTSLVHLIKNMSGIKEGFKESADEILEEAAKPIKKAIDQVTEEETKPEEKEKNNFPRANGDTAAAMEEESEAEEDDEEEDKEEDAAVSKAKENIKNLDKIANKGKTRLGYQNKQKLTPGLYNIPNKKQMEKQLGKADKMEQQYDNLEKVISGNGIQSISDSTKELIKQQNDLLKGLKDITPALHEAMGAIGKVDLGSITSIFKK
tara:strand:- start:1122 stop:1928 length:807 start_codon:yes stop_codon:yes gene_type:complete